MAFRFLNKLLRPRSSIGLHGSHGPHGGQVSVILILVIAILFIFFAVILNLGKVAQTKTLVTIASNVSASFLGSSMASYTEYLYQMQLGGQDKADTDLTVCGWTGVAAAIISIILVAIGILTAGSTLALVVAVIAAVLAVASFVIQLTVIQPEITNIWEKMMESMSKPDSFVERGIRAELQYSIDDNKPVSDSNDIDSDALSLTSIQLLPPDQTTRFAVLYTKRMKQLSQVVRLNPVILQDYLNTLGDFLHANPYVGTWRWGVTSCAQPPTGDKCTLDDRWGIWDSSVWDSCGTATPNICCSGSIPLNKQDCNRCCLPNGLDRNGNPYRDRDGNLYPDFEQNIRPSCCDSIDPSIPSCGTASTCPDQGYWPWIFDVNYEDSSYGYRSLRQFIGTDDENRFLFYRFPPRSGSYLTTDFYPSSDYFSFNTTGTLFPLLWKLSDVGIMDPTTVPVPRSTCFWCDTRRNAVPVPPPPTCNPQDFGWGPDRGAGWPSREPPLPTNCAGTQCCASDVGGGIGVMDRVTNPDRLILGVNACYLDPPSPSNLWKKGATRYCSTRWPYYISCPGEYCNAPPNPFDAPPSGPPEQCRYCEDPSGECRTDFTPDLSCTTPRHPTDTMYWVEDPLDGIRYEIDGFINWANEFLGTDPSEISADFEDWFPQIQSIMDGIRDWSELMDTIRTNIQNWRDSNRYNGASCSDMCFPPVSMGCAGAQNNVTIPMVLTCLENKRTFYENIRAEYDRLVAQQALWRQQALDLEAERTLLSLCNNACNWTPQTYPPGGMSTTWRACQEVYPAYQTFNTGWTNSWACWIGCIALPCPNQPNGNPSGPACPLSGPGILSRSQTYCGPAPYPPTPPFTPHSFDFLTWLGQEVNNRTTQAANLRAQANALQPQIDALALQIPLAQNIIAKIVRRHDYLQSTYNEAGNAITILNAARDRMIAFITSSAWTNLLADWSRVTAANANNNGGSLGAEATYGWQDESNSCIDGSGNKRGCWHIVRADAKIPGRCGNRCGRPSQGGHEPYWPWIKTWTKDAGAKRCYALGDSFDTYADGSGNDSCDEKSEYDDAKSCFRGGVAKSRVTRWDEDKANVFKFANAIPIWRFIFHRPNVVPALPTEVDQIVADDVGNPSCKSLLYDGAFMINRSDVGSSLAERNCWAVIKPFLQQGVMSQTCSEYFFHDTPGPGGSRGFNVTFAKCYGPF